MIKEVKEFNKHVGIAGFADVHMSDVDQFLNLTREMLDAAAAVQFFDAKLIAGWQHLYFAALNALKAFKNKTNISKNLAVECLLYASAQRQIKAALDLVGIRRNSSRIGVLIIADKRETVEKTLEEVSRLISGKRDGNVLVLSDEKMANVRKLFGISDTELAAKLDEDGEKKAVSDLVIEHIALLVTQR